MVDEEPQTGRRWDDLAADLEAQMAAEADRELAAEIADRTRRERSQVPLLHRLQSLLGRTISVTTGAGVTRGVLDEAGLDWLLVREEGADVVLPLAAVLAVDAQGPPGPAAPPDAVAARSGLGLVLRRLARDRLPVVVSLGGTVLRGRIDTVGADYLELSVPDSRGARLIPMHAITSVRRS